MDILVYLLPYLTYELQSEYLGLWRVKMLSKSVGFYRMLIRLVCVSIGCSIYVNKCDRNLFKQVEAHLD